MDYRGSQIFIVHQDAALRNHLVSGLRHLEFEAFGIDHPDKVELRGRRDSVLFINPPENNPGDLGELTSRLDRGGEPLKVVSLGKGVQSSRIDAVIDAGPEGLLAGIVAYLEEIHARGHRHFVRFGSQNASIAMFNFVRNERRFAGVIHDISAAGISCTFRPEPESLEDIPVSSMNLSLPSDQLPLSGRFISDRVIAGQPIHVFLFDKDQPEDFKEHIYDFIYASLEAKLSLH